MGAGDSGPVVEIEVEVTLHDYLEFNWWHSFRSRSGRAQTAAFACVAIVSAALAVHAPDLPRKVALGAIAALMVVSWVVFRVIGRAMAARAYQSNMLLRKTHRLTISPGGVTTESSAGSAHVDWSHFWRAYERPGAFYLYTATNMALTLPKRCFESEEQMERFREIVRAGVVAERCRV
jgi:hypothetical protein